MNARFSAGRSNPAPLVPVWRSDCGQSITCIEKIKVLNENIEELAQVAQDALEDGVLMGCAETQLRQAFHAVIDRLTNPYLRPRETPAGEV